jgi:hypothetical protein
MIEEDVAVLRVADDYVGEFHQTRDDGLWRGFWVTEGAALQARMGA